MLLTKKVLWVWRTDIPKDGPERSQGKLSFFRKRLDTLKPFSVNTSFGRNKGKGLITLNRIYSEERNAFSELTLISDIRTLRTEKIIYKGRFAPKKVYSYDYESNNLPRIYYGFICILPRLYGWVLGQAWQVLHRLTKSYNHSIHYQSINQ